MIKKCIVLITLTALFFIASGAFAVHAEGMDSLSSVSAVLYEPQSGRALYEKDAHTPRPMASTTKIMTALLAAERCPLDRVITVSAEAVRVEGSALGLRGGDQITMLDLVTGLLLVSGNDAANVIAYAVTGNIPSFAKLMNERAEAIGMKDTVFVTPSGLDQGGHSSSAWDMALLASEALKNEIIAGICAKESAQISFGNPPRKFTVKNHNKLLKLYPYAVGIKTGFTKKSGRCLVSAAEKDGVQLVAVTLKAGDDWNDHIIMYEYGFSITELISPEAPFLPPVKVTGGKSAQVTPKIKPPPAFTILKDEKERLRVEISLPEFLIAPVKAGEKIGSVSYIADDCVLCRLELTASDDVNALPLAGFWRRLTRGLSSLLKKFFMI